MYSVISRRSVKPTRCSIKQASAITIWSSTKYVRKCTLKDNSQVSRRLSSLKSSEQSTSSCGTSTKESVITSPGFWTSKQTWSRSAVNTFRCLVGCTIGDFSTMWWLQSTHPELSTILTMSLSMAAGITTSVLLETALLHFGKDCLPWQLAARTAIGMSTISMLAMEVTENVVDYSLTGGNVNFESPYFWFAASISVSAGFLVPLPYNYFRLRAYKKSCH